MKKLILLVMLISGVASAQFEPIQGYGYPLSDAAKVANNQGYTLWKNREALNISKVMVSNNGIYPDFTLHIHKDFGTSNNFKWTAWSFKKAYLWGEQDAWGYAMKANRISEKYYMLWKGRIHHDFTIKHDEF